MVKTVRLFVLFIAFAVGAVAAQGAWAAAASGTLTATEACEAFVSKNKRTNPDDSRLAVGEQYTVFEANKAVDPSWYRLRMESADPPERWVARHCGTGEILVGDSGAPTGGTSGGAGGSGGSSGDQCTTAGLEDSYVLALSWQPAFCETKPDKPECRIDDPKVYQARNFTLHGLWPNKASCGTRYGFCGDERDPGGFCDYTPLQLFTEVREDLELVMPSAAAGSCLQRHEWYKHGTCQTKWSIDEYWEVAIDLVEQFNRSGAAYLMSRNIGEQVETEAFLERIDCALGAGARDRVQLKCKNGNLVDVYISLPKEITPGADLGALMSQADPKSGNQCGDSFRVDPIGQMN